MCKAHSLLFFVCIIQDIDMQRKICYSQYKACFLKFYISFIRFVMNIQRSMLENPLTQQETTDIVHGQKNSWDISCKKIQEVF